VKRLLQLCATLGVLLSAPEESRALGCLQDGWDDGTVAAQTIFPNWYRVNVMSGSLWLYPAVAGPAAIQIQEAFARMPIP